jgi:hypothetical protein
MLGLPLPRLPNSTSIQGTSLYPVFSGVEFLQRNSNYAPTLVALISFATESATSLSTKHIERSFFRYPASHARYAVPDASSALFKGRSIRP